MDRGAFSFQAWWRFNNGWRFEHGRASTIILERSDTKSQCCDKRIRGFETIAFGWGPAGRNWDGPKPNFAFGEPEQENDAVRLRFVNEYFLRRRGEIGNSELPELTALPKKIRL